MYHELSKWFIEKRVSILHTKWFIKYDTVWFIVCDSLNFIKREMWFEHTIVCVHLLAQVAR